MELAGVRLGPASAWREIRGRVHDEVAALEREIWDLAGEEFTIGSPQQLGAVLFEKLGLSRKRRGKTGFSTDARVLQAIRDEHEIIPKIERWRELNQLDEDLPRRAAAAGRRASRGSTRRSCRRPRRPGAWPRRTRTCRTCRCARELGREIRGCFEAAPGQRAASSADYSQVELRILAHVADEPVLEEIFIRGEDVHTATASQVFGKAPEELTPMDRSKAKMINYGIVYGLSDYGLADRLNIPREEAKAFIDAYLERFTASPRSWRRRSSRPRSRATSRRSSAAAARSPSCGPATTRCGRSGERLAVNTVIQGTAADVMKLAMIGVAPRAAASRPARPG